MVDKFFVGSATKTVLRGIKKNEPTNQSSIALLAVAHQRATALRKNMYQYHNPKEHEGKKDN
jgi:hypothetical protein